MNGELVFASVGPGQISPSCNNFAHNRKKIISYLKKLCVKRTDSQWDEIWLIDYSEIIIPLNNFPLQLDSFEI